MGMDSEKRRQTVEQMLARRVQNTFPSREEALERIFANRKPSDEDKNTAGERYDFFMKLKPKKLPQKQEAWISQKCLRRILKK